VTRNISVYIQFVYGLNIINAHTHICRIAVHPVPTVAEHEFARRDAIVSSKYSDMLIRACSVLSVVAPGSTKPTTVTCNLSDSPVGSCDK
jgi:hypothetical protein